MRGVELRPEFNHITVRINGAKVGESSGQLWRELDVAWRSVPHRLRDRLAEVETFVVGICSKTALRNAVADFGQLLWPKGPRVCPYHHRHQVAEDLRAAGWTADEIGAALGHRVGETSSKYGRRIRVRQGGVARVPTVVRGGVRTAVPVRPTAVFDPAPLRVPQRRGSRPNKT
jgi:hypothetical protein